MNINFKLDFVFRVINSVSVSIGRTVIMSQRTSKSPYARKRKATSSSSQQRGPHEAPQNYQHQSSVSPDVSTQTVQHSPTQFIQPITDNRPDNTGSDCIPVFGIGGDLSHRLISMADIMGQKVSDIFDIRIYSSRYKLFLQLTLLSLCVQDE
jgi:hypothetical protein